MLLSQTVHEIYSGEAVACSIFDRFLNVDNFRPEVYSDVISGVVVDPTGVKKVGVKFGDSKSNRSRDIRLLHFVQTTTTADGPYDNRAKRRLA